MRIESSLMQMMDCPSSAAVLMLFWFSCFLGINYLSEAPCRLWCCVFIVLCVWQCVTHSNDTVLVVLQC